MEPPRGQAPPGPGTGQPTKSTDNPSRYDAPSRPPVERIHQPPGWTHEGGRAQNEQSAIANIKWRNAQNAARAGSDPSPSKGQTAIRADIQKAQNRSQEQGQARERAAAPETAPVKGKAGIRADLYKAMQSETRPSGPSRDGGRGR